MHDSIGKIIDLTFVHHSRKKLTIKFEIDTNPPQGSHLEVKFLEFPLDCSIVAQDLSSSFAGKCHALLCREYVKGRDWYDFAWYVARKVSPNLVFLEHALYQQGPWTDQRITVTPTWLIETMEKKIKSIDWKKAASDVAQSLNTQDKRTLNLWGVDFFLDKLNKLENYIKM